MALDLEESSIRDIFEEFKSKKIVVLGDYYLDEYLHCEASQLSPEAPVQRAIIQKIDRVPGCAGNIATTLSVLGADVKAMGVIGNDEKGKILCELLSKKEVNIDNLINDPHRITGVFSRILLKTSGDLKQHNIRFDLENKDKVREKIKDQIIINLTHILSECDLLFVADYDETKGIGLIDKDFLNQVVNLAKQFNVSLIGMSRLNIKDFLKFDVLICNQKELNDSFDGDPNKMLISTESKKVLITKGNKGLSIYSHDNKIDLPSYAKSVVDVCGAGDALASGYALSSLIEIDEKLRGIISSQIAAVAISKEGTALVFPEEVFSNLMKKKDSKDKIVRDHSKLLRILNLEKNKGKEVVFTNGYFDLIHSGQIEFLKRAKQMGDLLIVGLNSDRSTKENKGHGRPILNESERLNILSALDAVDYVTIFDELTPVKIIDFLKPSILVKGGDLTIDEVIGKDILDSYGGKVKIISIQGGTRTENIIKKVFMTENDENKR